MKGGKYTILSVAKKVSMDLEEHGTHKLDSYIQWAKTGYRRLNEDTICQVRTTSLQLNAYNAIDLSEINDYVDWTKVGIQYGDKVYALGTANDISLLHQKDDCGNLISNPHRQSVDDVVNGTDLDSIMPYWFYGYYGNSGPNNCSNGNFPSYNGLPYKGYFSENKERNQLQFSSNINVPFIYIEYISDGTCFDGETAIDSRCYDYLCLFVHNERIRYRMDVSAVSKQQMSEDLFYEHNRLRKLINPLSKQDIVNTRRKGIRMAPHII